MNRLGRVFGFEIDALASRVAILMDLASITREDPPL